jgi:type VI secretion system protein ImpH
MARKDWAASDRVSWLAALAAAPHRFDFHVVLRRIECLFRDLPRWGEAARPSDEPVRLGQDPELAFAPSALASYLPATDGRPARLAVAFFGLFGPHGALPLHLTEYARERARHAGDRTLSAFADLFHHRMLVLFHRAWAVAQPTAAHDRASDRFTTYVGSLLGLGLPALTGRDAIPDRAKLQYAAHLANPSRHAEGLAAMLADYFEVAVGIEEFVGEWIELPRSGRFRLGHSREVSCLGRTTILGQRFWRCDHKFRIVLGPLSRADFQRLLPGSQSLSRMVAMVRAYVGDELDWDVRLVLDRGERDQVRLGHGDRLGWNARLGQGSRARRLEDIIIHPSTNRTTRSVRSHELPARRKPVRAGA